MFLRATALTPIELQSAIARNPLIVSPETTVRSAIALMSGVRSLCSTTKTADSQLDELYLQVKSSCVLVVENERLLGILTERDVVRLTAQQQPLDRLVMENAIGHSIITLHESDFTDLFSTISLLQQHHIRHLPIVDERDRLVGLVTYETLRQTSRPIDLLRLRVVSEVMTSDVICAAPDTSIFAIAQLMANHQVSSVMIVEQTGNPTKPLIIPVGILTERDMVQFQALGLNLGNCTAQMVMSTPIFTIKPEDSLWTVQEIMRQRFINRLAVTGSQGELLGIVTQTSLLQALNPLEIYKLAGALEEKVTRLEAEKMTLLENRTIELEQQVETRTATLKTKAQQEKLLIEIATQIRSSLSLQTILDTTVEQVRKLLGCDRVNIWQFEPNWETIALAEATHSSISLVGERIADSYFRQNCTEMYRQGHICIMPDIDTAKISHCHREMLIQLQTRAQILVPILCGDRLWGLLNVTESQHPRHWLPEEIELLRALSIQLAIAIAQATTHEELQQELSKRQQAEIVLHNLIEGTAATTGQDFFPALVTHIAAALNVFSVTVAELIDRELHALASWSNGALQPTFSGDPAHSPCERALQDGKFYCESSVQQMFPQYLPLVEMEAESYLGIALRDNNGTAIGTLCIINKQRIPDPQQAENLLRVFAARAAAELERQRATKLLEQVNQSLEAKIAERTAELSQVNSLQRAILDGANYSIVSTDLNGTIVTFNGGAERMLGYSAAEIVGKVTPEEFHDRQQTIDLAISFSEELGQNITPTFEVFIAKARQGIFSEQEWTYIRKDGSRFPVLLSTTTLKDANNQIIGFLGIAKDISDRKHAEAELEKLSERLALALKSADIGCWEWDFVQNIAFWDERMYQLYGATKESDSRVVYEIWANSIHPDDRTFAETLIQQAILEQKEYDTEFRVIHPDGNIHFIKAYGVVVRDAQGQPQKIIGVNFDISDRKRAEVELQQVSERLALALKSGNIGYWECNFVQKTLFWDEQMYELYGITKQTDTYLAYEIWSTRLHPDDHTRIKTLIQQAILGEAEYDTEFRFLHPDGNIRFIKGYGVLVRDTQGKPHRMIGVHFDISDRKLMEEKLAESEAKFRRLVEGANNVIWSSDLYGTITYLSPQFESLFGWEPSTWLGQPFMNLVHPEDLPFVANDYRENILAGKQSKNIEFRHRHQNGQYLWVRTSATTIKNAEEAVIGCQGILADISDLKQTELALKASEILFRKVFSSNIVGMMFTELDGEIVDANDCLLEMIGYTREDLNAHRINWRNITPPEYIPLDIKMREELEHFQKINPWEKEYYRKDGSRIPVIIGVALLSETNSRCICVVVDISERKLLEHKILQSEKKMRAIFDSITDIILTINLHNDEVESIDIAPGNSLLNNAFHTEIMNETIRFLFEPELHQDWVEKVRKVVQSRETIHFDYFLTVGGKLLWFSAIISPISETEVTWVARDITERKQYETQLQQTNQELARATRLKDEFLANMSHELRTPLNAILGMTEGLQEEVFGNVNNEQIKALQTVEKSAEHLLSLINDILDVAKIESGQIELDCTPVVVSQLCQSSLAFIKQQALHKRIQLEIKLPPNAIYLPDLLVDERRIRQVLINLLNNAVKFTLEGGRITLEVTYPHTLTQATASDVPPLNYMRIAVIDTGIGIAQENINKLFQPFIQIDSALNRQYQGTGLGLALVKRIVEIHGGQVGLTSEIGVGSCFTIDLPCSPSSPSSPFSPSSPSSSSPLSSPSPLSSLILLAEDNEANISTISSYLTAKGYRLISAKNGYEAIALAKSEHPDLILMDIQMPGMDGLEAMQHIRRDPSLVDVPIIALTALAMTADRDRCLAAGANDYLSKPVKLKQLATTIQQLLDAN